MWAHVGCERGASASEAKGRRLPTHQPACTWRKVPTPKRVLIDTQLVLGRLTHLSMHVLPPLKWQGVRSNLNVCLSLALPLTTTTYHLPVVSIH